MFSCAHFMIRKLHVRRPRPRLIYKLLVWARTAKGELAGVPTVVCSVGWPSKARTATYLQLDNPSLLQTLSDGENVLSCGPLGGRDETSPPHPVPCFLPKLKGKCLNCLSSSNRVATCRLPQCYLHCKGFRHSAHDCKMWAIGLARTVVLTNLDALPRRSA